MSYVSTHVRSLINYWFFCHPSICDRWTELYHHPLSVLLALAFVWIFYAIFFTCIVMSMAKGGEPSKKTKSPEVVNAEIPAPAKLTPAKYAKYAPTLPTYNPAAYKDEKAKRLCGYSFTPAKQPHPSALEQFPQENSKDFSNATKILTPRSGPAGKSTGRRLPGQRNPTTLPGRSTTKRAGPYNQGDMEGLEEELSALHEEAAKRDREAKSRSKTRSR